MYLIMTLMEEIEELLSQYKNKKLTKKVKEELKVKIYNLTEAWIGATCQGMLV